METFPATLSTQRLILGRLLRAVESDPRWQWLEVGCSIAEGRADALSDLDLGLGVAEDAWDAALVDLPALLENLAPVVGGLYHRLPQLGAQVHLRAFVQYVNGAQIDLVALPAHVPKGHKPEDIVLYDPAGLLGAAWNESFLQATSDTVYEWTFLAWVALSDLVKYLRRGTPWEALERLHDARAHGWRLWAVAKGLRYPGFGLTTVLDHPEVSLPPGIDATTAHANETEIYHAARAVAHLLAETSRGAAAVVHASLPDALAAHVIGQLKDLGRLHGAGT